MEAASTLLLSILEAGWIWWPAMFDKRPAPDDPGLEALGIACGYYLTDAGSEARTDWGPYGPVVVYDGLASAPYIGDVADSTLALWATIIEEVDHPSVTSRLADLLWIRRWPPAHEHGAAAVEALIECGRHASIEPMEQVDLLARSADIALELNRQEAFDRIAERAIEIATDSLAGGEYTPGVYLGAIEITARLDRSLDASVELLRNALNVGGGGCVEPRGNSGAAAPPPAAR